MPTIAEVLDRTADAARDPAGARPTVRASARLTGLLTTEVRTGHHTLAVDEPESLAGADSGPSPTNLALAALASCQTITYRFWAEKLGIALDEVEVRVEGDLDLRGLFGLDDAVRPGFTAIRVTATPSGPESPERYAELAAAVDAHCPVLDLFTAGTRVRTGPDAAPPRG